MSALIRLLSDNLSDMTHKLRRLEDEAKRVGPRINIAKTKEMRVTATNSESLYVKDNLVERVIQFTCLGSTIDESGGTETDVATRIQEAFIGELRKVWNSRAYCIGKKLRLFNSNVKSVLLHGCETWKDNKNITKHLQVFINKCRRRILRILWPVQISNNDLWIRTKQIRIDFEIWRRSWGWLGNTLRKPPNEIARLALDWNPQGSQG
jgi:hypothetical protein